MLPAPLDVRSGIRTSVQPDILVIRREDVDLDSRALDPPLLAVEVLSPSTRDFDPGLKRRTYARLGVPLYRIVDPVGPSLLVLELTGDEYAEVGAARGDESLSLQQPFAVSLAPAQLLVGLG